MTRKTYDEKSWELAEHFLSVETFPDAANRRAATIELAVRIQNCCEDFCEEIEEARDLRAQIRE